MKIIVSHPTGNANVREVLKGFTRAGILGYFYTAIAVFPKSIWYQLGTLSPLKELHRRLFDPAIQKNTKMFPLFEIGRLSAAKFNFRSWISHETGAFSIDSVYQNLDKKVANQLKKAQEAKGISAIYAYEDGAEYSFKKARELGLLCLYDLPTGYWKASRYLLEKELTKNPKWANTFTGFKDSKNKLDRKDSEIALSDVIFVASQFTENSLKLYENKLPPIKTIPYGFPPVYSKRSYENFSKKRKVSLLFVGKVTQQKGIGHLFDAVKGLEDYVELTVVGKRPVENFSFNEELNKHRYLDSLSHEDVLKLMRKSDILVFPTLFDGFGMVITEAMSQGTPVIATERCAGPDLISHGIDGWLIEAGSTEALKNQIEEIIMNPNNIQNIGIAAMETARKRPWEVYGQEVADAIKSFEINKLDNN